MSLYIIIYYTSYFDFSVQVGGVCESVMLNFYFSGQVGDVCESVMPSFAFSGQVGDVCESVMLNSDICLISSCLLKFARTLC